MNKPASLKEIEKKAYLSYFQDGLWDLSWGIWFAAWAIAPALEYWGIFRLWGYSLMFLPALIIWAGKKYLTIPRLGLVKFGANRMSRKRQLLVAMIIMVAITIGLLILTILKVISWSNGFGYYSMAYGIGLIIAVKLCIIAYFMEYGRMYIYGILMGAAIPAAKVLNRYTGEPLDTLIAFGLPAAVIIFIGTIMLLKFLTNYPRPIASQYS